MKVIEKQENVVCIRGEDGIYQFQAISDTIIRAVYTKKEEIKNQSYLINPAVLENTIPLYIKDEEKQLRLKVRDLEVTFCKDTSLCTWSLPERQQLLVLESKKALVEKEVKHYSTGGNPPIVKRVHTVDGERSFIENLKEEVVRIAYEGTIAFNWKETESIHGFGQGEEGIYNYRYHTQYLYQHNMRIPMPMFISSEGYGILLDCGSIMKLIANKETGTLYLDTIEQLDYYVISGENLDQIIAGYRYLTGAASMLPKWAFGYIQSKEAYQTANELLDIGTKYRELQVPIDCIVQDWNTWIPGLWGEKMLDPSRYANMLTVSNQLKKEHIHTMVSIWPNMAEGGNNHHEFAEKNLLLNDYSTYNAFSEEARTLYWKQASTGLLHNGFDSWWCDSTEPFSGPDWCGEIMRTPKERYELVGGEHKKYLDPTVANLFALEHARGIFENQRKETMEKRVLNLTRSGYASQQKYGVVLWSGDISASWKEMKKQIVEGLNMCMSGMPYWTLDIGGFFVVGSAWQKRGCNCNTNPNPLWFWKGEYNDGVEDMAYRELYTRWLQFGCFLPIFRSHGTDTPREIWNFGKEGTMFYDSIRKFIQLRYHLLPYLYSLAAKVTFDGYTILRSLLFDYAKDDYVKQIDYEYMFGPYILVCPVTEPMYYAIGNQAITGEKKWCCYLPKGNGWYDFWTNKRYEGGQEVLINADIYHMPLFVKVGSILPFLQEDIQYTEQPLKKPILLKVYSGEDTSFTLYEDAGDGYGYENGEYCRIQLIWKDNDQKLIIGKREGTYVPDSLYSYEIEIIK